MSYKRILTIQDISCVGQCSMTVALPILSACGHEVCILPSKLLSTHTGGFSRPAVTDLSDEMEAIWRHWQHEGVLFDAIYTGYLGSISAIENAEMIIDHMVTSDGVVIVDPAMADHGKLYSGFSAEYAERMQQLALRADVMLPNITEAAMMTGLPFEENPDEAYIRTLLQHLGGKNVVLTGAGFAEGKTGAAIREDGKISFCLHEKLPCSLSGTGDIFASAMTGSLMHGKSLLEAVRIAGDFTLACIRNTMENPAHRYGVKFEPMLGHLIKMLQE